MESMRPSRSTLRAHSSPLAMRRIRQLPHLFVRIPHESTVPKVIGLIRDNNIGNTDKTANDIVGTAAAVNYQHCNANLESLVQLVVKELVQIESSKQSADLVGEVWQFWRRSLLEDMSVSVDLCWSLLAMQ